VIIAGIVRVKSGPRRPSDGNVRSPSPSTSTVQRGFAPATVDVTVMRRADRRSDGARRGGGRAVDETPTVNSAGDRYPARAVTFAPRRDQGSSRVTVHLITWRYWGADPLRKQPTPGRAPAGPTSAVTLTGRHSADFAYDLTRPIRRRAQTFHFTSRLRGAGGLPSRSPMSCP
jgi:hypothetical protein